MRQSICGMRHRSVDEFHGSLGAKMCGMKIFVLLTNERHQRGKRHRRKKRLIKRITGIGYGRRRKYASRRRHCEEQTMLHGIKRYNL